MKKLLPQICLLFLLLLPLLGWAQEVRINGRVVDAETKEPIPFASLSLSEVDTKILSDEQGYFQLATLKSVQKDSIIVMGLNYCRYAALIEGGSVAKFNVELIRDKRIVGRVFPGKSTTSFKTGDSIIFRPGMQYAFFINNDKRKQTRKMRSVSFYIGENGFPREFRIRIYSNDGVNHAPKTDLLTENVLVSVPVPSQWYTISLCDYNIAVPNEGYFVALEFATMDFHLRTHLNGCTPSGLIMRPAFDFKNSSMWSYSPEKGWALFPQSSSSRRYNAMVKMEVDAVD